MSLLSMNQITTYRWSLEEDIENYQQAGYHAIGVWRRKLDEPVEDRTIELLAGCGLTVSNLMWAGGFTGSDGHSLAESLDDAADALRLAATIAAGCLIIYPGGRNNHITRHAERLFRHALDTLLPLAEAVEVPLAIKPMHPNCAHQCSFLTDLDSVVALLDEFRTPWLKLAYDSYHFPVERRHQHLLAGLAPYIGIVQLGDWRHRPSGEEDRCQLGTGRLALAETIHTLQTAGYTGAFDVMLIGPEMEAYDYWTVLEHSQRAFHKVTHLSPSRSLV